MLQRISSRVRWELLDVLPASRQGIPDQCSELSSAGVSENGDDADRRRTREEPERIHEGLLRLFCVPRETT